MATFRWSPGQFEEQQTGRWEDNDNDGSWNWRGGGSPTGAPPGGGSSSDWSGGQSPTYNFGDINFENYLKNAGLPSLQSSTNLYQNAIKTGRSLYDPSSYLQAVGNQANFLTSAGLNAANAAARQYSSSAQRAGVSGMGSGVAKALSLMPALQQASGLRLEGEQFAAGQRAALADYEAGLTNQMAQMQQAYRDMLSGYNANIAGIQSGDFNAQRDYELALKQLAEQQRQFDEQQKAQQQQWEAQFMEQNKDPFMWSGLTDNAGNIIGGPQQIGSRWYDNIGQFPRYNYPST